MWKIRYFLLFVFQLFVFCLRSAGLVGWLVQFLIVWPNITSNTTATVDTQHSFDNHIGVECTLYLVCLSAISLCILDMNDER